jgi:hypothetical protein
MNIRACIFQCQNSLNKGSTSVIENSLELKLEIPNQVTKIYTKNNVLSVSEEKNIFYFNLIKSICDVKYFKGRKILNLFRLS